MFNVKVYLQSRHFLTGNPDAETVHSPSHRKRAGVIKKIISGGQTGADRAGLDFAIANGVPHGGWCPAGRFAEDGKIPKRYALRETPGANYPERTEFNVRDSDGTVIFSLAGELAGGSRLTYWMAIKHRKPCLHISKERDGSAAREKLREFILRNRINTLNVAGPRASTEPAIGRFTKEVLAAVLKE
ncbi:MAG: putative molybdenum carrier protein [Verrucomicrobia bacterium]|nr:putative molybdenum carrier protein [Verrucomicrobiota bacterium]